MAGGNWTYQNKMIPGVYIRFQTGATAGVALGQRGVVTICEPLSWGPVAQVTEVTPQTDLIPITGYDMAAPANRFLREIFKDPRHPYTLGLFGSIPSLSEDTDRLTPIEGMPPDPTRLPTGCPFHPRCQYATEACAQWKSEAYPVGGEHTVRCLRFQPAEKREEA